MGKILGLDLGITSVGYGIIEEDSYEIVKYGVRMFEENTADGNVNRRGFRGSRRLKARKRNRINAIKYLLLNNGIINSIDFPTYENIYELRVKGLTEKLSNIELANVLVNICKRRGSSLDVAIDEEDTENLDSASALSYNTNQLAKSGLYICEYVLQKINSGDKIRNHTNVFRTEDYEKELRKILSNQELSNELSERIVEIVTRRRSFAEGPGSYKFPTKYGSYREEVVDGKVEIKHVNLIDEMKGKCSVFKTEPRIAKCTYKACLFNLLNDLNNIKIDDKLHLTKEQKEGIINKFINPKGKITVAQLIKYIGVSEERLSGFRIDAKGKKLITTFDGYSKLLPILPEEILEDKDSIDEIIEILTKTLVLNERKLEINNLELGLTDDEIEKLANLTRINGYHSLSKKAMDIIIPEMFETEKNQMQIIKENSLGDSFISTKGPNIIFDDTAILSPVTKRVHMQALRVVNELRKEYGEFSAIVIETTRYKNSAEEKKAIQEHNARNEQEKKKTEELLLEIDKNPDKYNTMTKLKLRLYKEQEGKTIYAGLPIDLERLLNDPTAYQIEHIIPYAVSFDNSLKNKALASARENEEKGKRTPWQYFATGLIPEIGGQIKSWSEYESFVNNLKISKDKKKNLLNQDDVTKFENMEEFIARNLNDTSYAIRTVMNTMKRYFKANEINTNVFTVKGKFTNDFRNRVGLKKDRDQYIHHAIDALIIAGSKNQKVFNNAYKLTNQDNVSYINDTGEIFDYSSDPFDDPRFLQFISSLKQIEGKPEDFSYKVDKKTNRSFADQTIYSTRNIEGEDWVVKKYKDIYGPDGEKLKKLFAEGKANNLLMAKNDEKTFDLLKKIYESYKNEKNPFLKYKEEFGPIRKYSKDGNGPEISQIKYLSNKLNEHLDISHKYDLDNSKKKVVLLQNSPYRTDIYRTKEGVYKMLTIRRYHITQQEGKNVINSEVYEQLKINKKISNQDTFMFSLNKNDVINFITKKDVKDNYSSTDINRYFRFVGTNSDSTNVIEVKSLIKNTERIKLTIGKDVLKLEKYNVSPIGKKSKVIKEDLKLVW